MYAALEPLPVGWTEQLLEDGPAEGTVVYIRAPAASEDLTAIHAVGAPVGQRLPQRVAQEREEPSRPRNPWMQFFVGNSVRPSWPLQPSSLCRRSRHR